MEQLKTSLILSLMLFQNRRRNGSYWQSIEDLIADMTDFINENKGDFTDWMNERKEEFERWRQEQEHSFQDWREGQESDYLSWFESIKDILKTIDQVESC